MQKLKSLGLDKIPEELTPKDFANFDDSLAATEPILFDQSIFAMVLEFQEPAKVESDEEVGDDSIKVKDKCLEKDTSIELGNPIETLVFYETRRSATLRNENFSLGRK